MGRMTLQEMKNVDIRTVDPAGLVDIRDVKVAPEQSREARIMDFVAQVGNPYCFRVGKVAVKVSHTEDGPTLDERLESLMTRT